MIKRIAAIAGSTALLLATVAPVGATWGWGGWGQQSSDITVDVQNSAYLDVTTKAESETGDNWQNVSGKGKVTGVNDLLSGDASSFAYALVAANQTTVDVLKDCGCKGDVDVTVGNRAMLDVYTKSESETGDNDQYVGSKGHGWGWFHTNGVDGTNMMITGDAVSLSDAQVIANLTDISVGTGGSL